MLTNTDPSLLGASRADAPAARLRHDTIRALGAGAARELRWGLSGVSREVQGWRTLASCIPDPVLRADALRSSIDKRYYTDGAAFFWTLPSRRSPELLALLVAYQTIANYLDYASERGAAHRGASGGNLMLALVDAIDVGGPIHDYYAGHPWRDDGGYLRALVLRCRAACATLPRYELARPGLIREARRAQALELSHHPDPRRRDAQLAAFATEEFGEVPDAAWFEVAGSATSLLAVIALLALAADEASCAEDLEAARRVYSPWVGALSLMLDSFVDQVDDAETGSWSAIAYYPSPCRAERRIAELMRRSLVGAGNLRHGARHVLIMSMMVAMYLSSDHAMATPIASSARRLRRGGGALTMTLAPVLRAWRIVYRQRE